MNLRRDPHTTDNEPIRVTVDDREAASGVVEALRRHPDCRVELKRLRLGEYQVGGRLLFERKTLRDLVVSIIDGRFVGQVLQGLPHVGPVRAGRLIDTFGSVEGAITATAEQILQIQGLGPTLAPKIRWSIEEPVARYACEPTTDGGARETRLPASRL